MWNYRVVEERVNGRTDFWIREVYYNEDGTIFAMMDGHSEPYGESCAELKRDLQLMFKAFDLPVLKEWEIEFAPHKLKGDEHE
jgi:hypothetical protein